MKTSIGMKQNSLAKASAELSEHALEWAWGAEEVSRPVFALGFGIFLGIIKCQRGFKVTLERLDGFGLRLLPLFTEGPVETNCLGFVFRLPNVRGGTKELSGEFLSCAWV
jgi:hypothetical protein